MAWLKALTRLSRGRRSALVQVIALGAFAVALLFLISGFVPNGFCRSCGSEESVVFSALSVIAALNLGLSAFWMMVVEHHHSLYGSNPLSVVKEERRRKKRF